MKENVAKRKFSAKNMTKNVDFNSESVIFLLAFSDKWRYNVVITSTLHLNNTKQQIMFSVGDFLKNKTNSP